MALTQEDIAVIGQVIERQINARLDQREGAMRDEINQAFTQTGEAFEARLQQVIETERTLFFQALQEIMEMVRVTQAMVGGMTAQPEPVAPEDVDDDAFQTESDEGATVPTKGIIPTPVVHTDTPPAPPIGGATFGGG